MVFFRCTVGGGGDGSTLTVICYSDFAGLTIFITNGTDTFSEVCPSTSPYEVVFEGLADGMWTVSTVYGGQTYTKTVEITTSTTFNPIPNGATVTPINDIQTWLHCVDIWDKNYTTISQVLADASTLQALIASNNAADYMARSTNWASSVCANQTAMGYIGNNDYCAETLLANATWRDAICNSGYFESVLNVKVPTMTSNTAPSGTVFSSNNSTLAFHAFNNVDDADYVWFSGVNSYVGYIFDAPFMAVKGMLKNRKYPSAVNASKTFKIQGYDGTNWVDVTGVINNTNTNLAVNTFAINATHYYQRYRAYMLSGYHTDICVNELQFYGRVTS